MEKLHMQWDTIMGMQFYDFQNILLSYNDIIEQRQKDEEDEMKKQGYDKSNYSPEGMMSQVKKSMPKMPNINIPKF